MLMAGECESNGVGLVDKTLHEVGTFVRTDAAVRNNNDHISLFEHFSFIVLIGLDDIGKIDAFPVCGNIPLRNIGVTKADHSDLNAVKVLDLVGGIVIPGCPVLFLIAVGLSLQVVCHADIDRLLGFGSRSGQILQLLVEDL